MGSRGLFRFAFLLLLSTLLSTAARTAPRADCPDYPSPGAVRAQVAAWNTSGYRVHEYGDGPSKVVLMGERHNDAGYIADQVRLIRALRPSVIVYESAAAWRFDPVSDSWRRQPGRRIVGHDEVLQPNPPLMNVARELRIPIVGADLTHAELDNVGRRIAAADPTRYRLRNGELRRRGDPEFFFSHQSDEAMPFRDRRMADTILAEAAAAEGPILVILGNLHARNLHGQHLLEPGGFGYTYIDQTAGR